MSLSLRPVPTPISMRLGVALSIALLAACAHSGHASHPTSQPGPAMNPASEVNTAASPVDAKAVGDTVLKLIAGLRSSADLNAEWIQRETGWTLQASDEGATHRTGAALSPDWGYTLSLFTPVGAQRQRLRFEYNRKNDHATASAVCDPDMQRYAQTLEHAGYRRSPISAEHDRVLGWNFQRGDLRIRIHTRSESDDAFEHECVSLIIAE